MCSIRLSEPLLKLRPRKDLVEVLKIAHESAHKMYCASLPTPYMHFAFHSGILVYSEL